eukprot:TRINITY_DN1633_c0_g1_i3.p1 TRINITY_DN1633_c0_g1~~TRINITY_DN1633_c0_g1_i3.p1  ORF type:complete len:318 (+),score=53.25 TRINITY_DN1633_c0_g1_i3:305-1258(+)
MNPESENEFASELSEEIIQALPSDPYQLLGIASKITSFAFRSIVSKLEIEAANLRSTISEKDHVIQTLEEKANELQNKLTEASNRLNLSLEEQARLSQENNSLSQTVKKLNRDVAKLEAFKKTLMQSLREEQEPNTDAVLKASMQNDSESATSRANVPSVKEHGNNLAAESTHQVPAAVPETVSPGIEDQETIQESSKKASPKKAHSQGSSARTTPPRSPGRRHSISLHSSLPSYHTTAPNSPPPSGRAPKADGKEFFRQVRSRLSFEQFTAFLANIKELNQHRQSREETLRKANELFGTENRDFYATLENLLSRHQ